MPSTISRRFSLPLSNRDEADLALIRRSPERLRELDRDLTDKSSESAILHAVFEKGLQSIKEESIKQAYLDMGADLKRSAEAAGNRTRLSARPRDTDAD